jgi:hypothetical protein
MIIGIQMGIQNVPKTFEEAVNYMDSYDEKYMAFHPANAKLAVSTEAIFLTTVPSVLHPLAQKVVHALCTPRLRVAVDFPKPLVWVSLVARTALVAAELPPAGSATHAALECSMSIC